MRGSRILRTKPRDGRFTWLHSLRRRARGRARSLEQGRIRSPTFAEGSLVLFGSHLRGRKQERTVGGDDYRRPATSRLVDGRTVTFDGTTKTWIAVVILDHPNCPSGVTPTSTTKLPTVFILRRDWEFVWDQLRSASAVVDYFHRVATSTALPQPLGEESLRYLELAHADLNAEPTQTPWMNAAGLTIRSGPTLPIEPASTDDSIGHALFRGILDDIAESDFDGDEQVRLDILGFLDRYAVTDRAQLGRALIEWLDACMISPPSHTRLRHRTMLLDDGHLQLAFSVLSSLTGYHRELHRNWLMLRRHQLLDRLQALHDAAYEPEKVWTVGVLLTPRPDGRRLWDTTIAATNAVPDFDAETLALWTRTFGQFGTEGNLNDAGTVEQA